LLAHFAVASRAGVSLPTADALPAEVADEVTKRSGDAAGLAAAPAGRIVSFAMTPLAISSSAIRARLTAGGSVRYLIPGEVLAYIEANALYAGA
jgi:nicotinate-nucleotide adenylyltransferase